MTHGSLFTGIGGFDLGFERASIDSVWQVENDVKAQETLQAHFPNVERFTDVRECKGLKSVDVISGGFPCQDLSVAGRRAGLDGERSGLWFEFHRILAELKPRWVVVENVPGLLSSNGGRDFAVILRGLVELGYGVSWRILDAQYFGVAQRRRRVFIVASFGDHRCQQVLFESEGLSGNPAKSRKAGSDIAASLRSRSAKSGVSMPGRGGEDDFNIVAFQPGNITRPAGAIPSTEVFPTLKADAGDQHPHIAIVEQNNVSSTPAKPSLRASETPNFAIVNCLDGAPYADRAAEETKSVVAATLNNGDHNGGFRTEPGQGYPAVTGQFDVRRLTPTECERLQGFPDGWTKMHKDTVRYRQIGNAVAVPVAEWIGKRLMEVAKNVG